MNRKILVAVDGSRASAEAVDYATRMAKENGQHLILLYVLEDKASKMQNGTTDMDAEYLKEKLNEAIRLSAPSIWIQGVNYSTHIEVGNPAEKIHEVANRLGVAMIVVGYVGLKGISKLKALTSGARTVVEKSDIPVLMVPIALRH